MPTQSQVPWWARIAIKVGTAHVPGGRALCRGLGYLRHGDMANPAYAYDVFMRHFNEANPKPGFVGLELGPGDSLFSAPIAYSYGGHGLTLVDNGDYACRTPERYRAMISHLEACGRDTSKLASWSSVDSLLEVTGARYLPHGLAALRTLPSKSVDFIWSHAVLEHVRRAEFEETLGELRRIIRDDGVCSHRVDLRDHLGGALNNLRFSRSLWETAWMANSGFYTNRIRFAEMCAMFRQAAFDVEIRITTRWPKLPTPRVCMDKEFAALPEEDLCVYDFLTVLRPR